MKHYTAAVITVSDKGYRGEREDTSGPALCAVLKERGYEVVYTAMVPDEAEMIRAELLKCADEKKLSLVLTTGGTGFSPGYYAGGHKGCARTGDARHSGADACRKHEDHPARLPLQKRCGDTR